MKKSKLFDIIVYRFLLSLPVSCLANLVYGFMLFFAVWIWSDLDSNLKFSMVFSAAVIPFIIFNMIRYMAIKNGHLRYGIIGLIISSIPEYLFIIVWALLAI